MPRVIVNQQTACSLDLTRADLRKLRKTLSITEAPHPSCPDAYVLTYEHVNGANGATSTRRIYVRDARTVTAQDARRMLSAPQSKLAKLAKVLARVVRG